MCAMSAVRKPKDAAKPAKAPGPPPKGKGLSKGKSVATPIHDAFADTYKDAELSIVGAEERPGAARKFKKGERFVVPIWSVKLLEELATVALGQRLAKDNAVVHDAQYALLMAAIPAYIARARVENNRPAPDNGFAPDPELYKAACASVARVLEQGFFDEAQTLTRALRRLLSLATMILVFNWGGFLVSLRNAYRRSGGMVPTIYLASAFLTTAAYLSDPRPDCRWMFLIPLSDFSNYALPLIAATSIPKVWKRIGGAGRILLARSDTGTMGWDRRATGPAPAR